MVYFWGGGRGLGGVGTGEAESCDYSVGQNNQGQTQCNRHVSPSEILAVLERQAEDMLVA